MRELNLLLIDDNNADFEIVKQKISKIKDFKFNLFWLDTFSKGKAEINNRKYDIILVDTLLNDGNGLDLLLFARENNNGKPIIIITGVDSEESDMIALSNGADDYVIKSDLGDTTLERSIRYTYEKYHAKLKISQREVRYRNLFEKSLDSIATVDTDFNLIEINQSMVSLFKSDVEVLINSNLLDFFYSKEESATFCSLIEDGGLVKKHKTKLSSKENELISAEMTSIVLFNLDNRVSGYQVIIKDLSKEKINEQRIIRAEKLGMTGRIARSIAHEVRNPLTNINLAIEQLKEDIPTTESNLMYVDIVNRNSNRINKLITELLNSSKPSSLVFNTHSINVVIQDAISLAMDRINLNGTKLTQSITGEIVIKLDAVQLKTAFLNIIINAIEAMEEQKGELHISLSNTIDEVQVQIKDNGKGMSKETLNKLFDPFFTGKSTGMGLGMTSTQNIIQQHNGNIDVESEEGKGTIFLINLPKAI